jgi:hypothetical protein
MFWRSLSSLLGHKNTPSAEIELISSSASYRNERDKHEIPAQETYGEREREREREKY